MIPTTPALRAECFARVVSTLALMGSLMVFFGGRQQ